MTDTRPFRDQRLPLDVEHAHERASAALDDPAASSLVAVTWASAHLAAVQKVLYPLAIRRLPGGRDRVHTQLAVDHRLQQVLWQLDRRLTGDVHLRSTSVDVLEAEVRRALHEHAVGERTLVTDLEGVVEPRQRRALADGLATAMLRGPTRPHPHTPHGRYGAGLVFWFDGVLDRARDGLDSRIVPTPHRTGASRPMTRWGAYAMGSPSDRPSGTGRA